MKAKYIITGKGEIISVKDIAKREASGWRGTLWTAVKECGGTGKSFLHECHQSTRNALAEVAGDKRKNRR